MELQFEVSKSCPGVNFYTSATVRHYPTGFFKKKRILEVLMGGAKRSPRYHHGGAWHRYPGCSQSRIGSKLSAFKGNYILQWSMLTTVRNSPICSL